MIKNFKSDQVERLELKDETTIITLKELVTACVDRFGDFRHVQAQRALRPDDVSQGQLERAYDDAKAAKTRLYRHMGW